MALAGPQAYSVADALAIAKGALERVELTVVGEVSELSDTTRYKAIYFSLGDDRAVLPCMMWRGVFESAGIELKLGAQVVVTGRFTLYEAKGRMQFSVRSIELAGEGRLRQQVAQRAEMLRREGLMDPARRRALPALPQRLALITSPSGKAVHDVLRTLARRFALVQVDFYGVQVEGDAASGQIVAALAQADASGADAILLVRGGGSYEDLLPFSSEEVARAVAACVTPVVTGIGHEPDTSIADMVADLRASTPTAAAEAVTPSADDIANRLDRDRRALAGGLMHRLSTARARLLSAASRPVFTDPTALIAQRAMALDALDARLAAAIPARIERDRSRLNQAHQRTVTVGRVLLSRYATSLVHNAERLDDLSPLRVLSRGYAAAFTADGHRVVDRIGLVSVGEHLAVRVSDGEIECVVEGTTPAPPTV